MKKQIIIALALLVSTFSFSQKDELKAAEKAIKSKNFADAKTAIQSAESLIDSADDKMKAKFYFLKGQALYANGAGSNDDTDKAIASFNKVKDIEAKAGKGKYSSNVDELKQQMLANFLTKANTAWQEKRFVESSDGFNKAYRMSTKDTLYLYYAASSAVNAQDYDTSLKLYEELREMGYTGIVKEYSATIKNTGESESFDSKSLRDFALKAGTHIVPKETLTDSKLPLIKKMLADIYIFKGEDDKAIAAIKEARAENPDDATLIIAEANIEYKLGNNDKYKSLMEEAILKDPNNATLRYNVGVMTMKEGEYETARAAFSKALEFDPTMKDAALNISTTYIEEGNKLLEEMNSLGTSSADFERYDELKAQKVNLFQEGANILVEFLEANPEGSNGIFQQLNNIYLAVGEVEKAKMYKAMIKE
ncbi:tetratricopeptide repeat protein [Psychroserpens ponticola]|uniref:Tetratricopeptide repeat protein n=1 Tax=Psychroserpens ponticola TaxID=2932268 RepID=A0ABY7RUN2_9FLAO|nr:tetratricopeptide repeat protein [Psychroserpens ponticola]WCO00380.1 tetratricopeptide repeat protein [Psychroserpens ponticola]